MKYYEYIGANVGTRDCSAKQLMLAVRVGNPVMLEDNQLVALAMAAVNELRQRHPVMDADELSNIGVNVDDFLSRQDAARDACAAIAKLAEKFA